MRERDIRDKVRRFLASSVLVPALGLGMAGCESEAVYSAPMPPDYDARVADTPDAPLPSDTRPADAPSAEPDAPATYAPSCNGVPLTQGLECVPPLNVPGPEAYCYTCEGQKRPECNRECSAGECWTCYQGRWTQVEVDCVMTCGQDAGTPDTSTDSRD